MAPRTLEGHFCTKGIRLILLSSLDCKHRIESTNQYQEWQTHYKKRIIVSNVGNDSNIAMTAYYYICYFGKYQYQHDKSDWDGLKKNYCS